MNVKNLLRDNRGKPRVKANYCPTLDDIKPPQIINNTIIIHRNESYYELVGKYTDGNVRVKYYFSKGYIEVDRGYVVGGEIFFDDGEFPINIYIFNGEMSISRNTGIHMWQFATTKELYTGDKFIREDKIKSILKKRYDELFVEEFMQLANDIYNNSKQSLMFDRFGERECW